MKIPNSMAEALSMGFIVIGSEGQWSDDELSHEGVVSMEKETSPGRTLQLSVPFTARYEYGTPIEIAFAIRSARRP